MVQRLYTINSSIIILYIFLLFFIDRACYKLAYPFYDKLHHLEKINDNSEIIILGSSGILWDIDENQFSNLSGKKTTMFSVAGGTLEFRYYLLLNLLEFRKNNLPKYVIFHADKIAFNRNRYGDEAYKSLQGYYHSGILREYLDYKWNNSLDSQLQKISRSYSLNSESYFILSKIYNRYFPTISRFEILNSDLYADEVFQDNNERQNKIDYWKNLYGDPEDFTVIDKDFQKHFELSIELMKKYPQIQFILLDTPMFKLFNDKYFSKSKEIYNSSISSNIHYIYINKNIYETEVSFFHDASHLNIIGRSLYTIDLYEELKIRNLLNNKL